MCRILSYLGKPILAEKLLYEPDNALITQSYHPRYMSHLLNLAGFGLIAWDKTSHNPQFPYVYKTPNLPFYDENLKNLASKITPYCLLAHIRGVSYTGKHVVSVQNVHPFIFNNASIALAHNGLLSNFDKMKYDLISYIQPEYQKNIRGTTDSEWIYALLLSQLEKNTTEYETTSIIKAVIEALKILHYVRQKNDIASTSPVNLFISNGEFIAATRFVFDYGWHNINTEESTHYTYHSLWYTYGDSYGLYQNKYQMKGTKNKSSIIISSEPLTEDNTTWIEIPEYTIIVAKIANNRVEITTQDIDV